MNAGGLPRRLVEPDPERVDAAGRLAGGVAHEMNGLLTEVLGHAWLLNARTDLALDARASVQEILDAARRATRVVEDVLAYGRRQRLRPGRVDLDEVVRNAMRTIRRKLPCGTDVDLVLAGDLPPIEADPRHLAKVLEHLVVRAREDELRRGRVRVETGLLRLEDGNGEWHAVLSVRSNGRGLEIASPEAVFDPFSDNGTNVLALAAACGLVYQMGGHVRIADGDSGGVVALCFPPASSPAKVAADERSHAGEATAAD